MILDNDFYAGQNLDLAVPLTHARIGWRNIVTPESLTVSSEKAGFPGEALANPFTYDLWRPSAFPAQIDVATEDQETVDYIGIARHNLTGCAVRVEYQDSGGAWQLAASFVPQHDRSLMVMFEPVIADSFRVIIESNDDPDVYASVLFLGEALAMARPIYGGHTPLPLSRRDSIRPSRSDSGQFLGRSRIRQGYTTSYQWQHLKADWVREHLKPFIDHAVTGSFFIAWRPYGYAAEAGYGWIDSNTSASNMGIRNYMSYGFTIEAAGDE